MLQLISTGLTIPVFLGCDAQFEFSKLLGDRFLGLKSRKFASNLMAFALHFLYLLRTRGPQRKKRRGNVDCTCMRLCTGISRGMQVYARWLRMTEDHYD